MGGCDFTGILWMVSLAGPDMERCGTRLVAAGLLLCRNAVAAGMLVLPLAGGPADDGPVSRSGIIAVGL